MTAQGNALGKHVPEKTSPEEFVNESTSHFQNVLFLIVFPAQTIRKMQNVGRNFGCIGLFHRLERAQQGHGVSPFRVCEKINHSFSKSTFSDFFPGPNDEKDANCGSEFWLYWIISQALQSASID